MNTIKKTIEFIGIALVAFICSILPMMVLMYLAEKIFLFFMQN
jgi:hypothetical protein